MLLQCYINTDNVEVSKSKIEALQHDLDEDLKMQRDKADIARKKKTELILKTKENSKRSQYNDKLKTGVEATLETSCTHVHQTGQCFTQWAMSDIFVQLELRMSGVLFGTNVIRRIKLRKIIWAGDIAHLWEMRRLYNILRGTSE
jgi:hypothetical protein